MPTLVCVPIKVTDADSALADAIAARNAGADLVEFRIDQFFPGSADPADAVIERQAVVDLATDSPLPCIVTCRPVGEEGGEYDGDEPSRIALFEHLAIAAGDREHPPRYIDVELATMERSANVRQKIRLAVDHPEQVRDLRTSLILSTHDFTGRPADLFRRLARMRAEPAAGVHKIAYLARSLRDNLDLFDLLAEADRPTIALAMGRYGLMSRVLAPKFGGFLTFAALRPAGATAPGQPTIRELLGLYRFRSIKASTRVYAIVGDPVEHSASPAVHNAGFEHLGPWCDASGVVANAVYLPFPIPAGYEHFKATMLSMLDHARLTFSGCSVTIPHKENLVRLALEQGWDLDELSRACAAGNTLVVERDASGDVHRCRVLNTDAPAGVACLESELGDMKGRRVALIGAGGVARALGAGLLVAGARVLIANRTEERARRLTEELASHIPAGSGGTISPLSVDELADTACEAYVNCTPVGMKGGPAPDDSPVSVAALAMARGIAGSWGSGGGVPAPPPVVMDTVYNPLETRLLADATAAGFRTIDGLSMFVRQARLQFRAWTGHDPTPGSYETLARRAPFADTSL